MAEEPTDQRDTEIRQVKVSDPALSAETNELLTEEARDVLGYSSVRVPKDRPHPADGDRPVQASVLAGVSGGRLMFLVIALSLVIVALIVGVSHHGWWFVPIAFIALVAALGWIIRTVLLMTAEREHVSPTTAAEMEAEGVANPDEYFSAIVDEFTEEPGDKTSEDRTVSARDNPAKASAEHQRATTPTSGPSKSVGP